MFPELTKPRGFRKASFASCIEALNSRIVSANDSSLVRNGPLAVPFASDVPPLATALGLAPLNKFAHDTGPDGAEDASGCESCILSASGSLTRESAMAGS